MIRTWLLNRFCHSILYKTNCSFPNLLLHSAFAVALVRFFRIYQEVDFIRCISMLAPPQSHYPMVGCSSPSGHDRQPTGDGRWLLFCVLEQRWRTAAYISALCNVGTRGPHPAATHSDAGLAPRPRRNVRRPLTERDPWKRKRSVRSLTRFGC